MTYRIKILAWVILILPYSAQSSVYDYLYPSQEPGFSSYGTTGIIQMPSARMLEEGSVSLNFSQFSPYQRISLIMHPFDWMEAIYQYTDISNQLYSDSYLFSGNQTYKDKGIDVKFRLLKESYYIPELSLGLRDIGGTGLFSSEYFVASKYLKNADFTFGLGWGNLNNSSFGNPLAKLSSSFDSRQGFQEKGGKGGEFSTTTFFRGKNIGIFSGYEYHASFIKGLRLKIEYDSTNYELEGFTSQPQKTKINYGLTYSHSKFFKLYAGFVRGHEVQLGFSFSNNYGKKNTKLSQLDSYKGIPRKKSLQNVTQDKRYLYLSALKYFNEEKYSLRSANLVDNTTLQISFAQNKHISYPRAYGRALRLLDDISPPNVSAFEITSLNSRFELTQVKVERDIFNAYKDKGDYKSLGSHLELTQSFDSISNHEFQPKSNFPKLFYQLGPNIQTHIGGADRFFAGGLNITGEFELLMNRNFNLQSIVRAGVTDTFQVLEQGSDSVLPHVRTDIIEYLKEGQEFGITRMQFNYFGNPRQSIYTKVSAGIFEEMFGGYGGEILFRPFDKNWAIGVEAYHAMQRSYNQKFGFKEYSMDTGHISLYYMEPHSRILSKISGGRYLAGDSGFTVDISREFKSGLRMGAFASITDISKEEFGEGSFDKGFYITFPLEGFSKNHSRSLSHFGMRPVTRDGAAKMLTGFDLYGVTDQGSLYNVNKNMDDWYD